MVGHRVGHAVRGFSDRYATFSNSLATELERVSFGLSVDEAALGKLWGHRTEAQNYVVIGDPAARVRVGDLVA